MKSGLAIVECYERKFHETISPMRRQYLVELIDTGMKEAYETAKNDFYRLTKNLAAKGATSEKR